MADVTFRKRSLDIGGQTYPLQSIARVGVWKFTVAAVTHYKVVIGLGLFGLILVSSGEVAAVLIGLFVLVLAGWLGWESISAKDKEVFSLRLETAGSPRDALYSYDRSAIIDLRDQVVGHLEEPTENQVTINNPSFLLGDQINVEGFGNTGKIVA